MIITEITVTSSTSFNHPGESYANFKPSVTLKASISECEDARKAVLILQGRAHEVVMAEKARILAEIERENMITRLEGDLKLAKRNIDSANYVLTATEERRREIYKLRGYGIVGDEVPTFEEFIKDQEERLADAEANREYAIAELAKLKEGRA
jgi:hypothetical protein